MVLGFTRVSGQFLSIRISDASFLPPLGCPLYPAIDCGCIPDHEGPGLRSALIPCVDQSHGHIDPERIESPSRRCDLFLSHDFCSSGHMESDARLQIQAVGIRFPFLADLQRFLYSNPARSKLPEAVVNSAPISVVDRRLRSIFALIRDARRDLLIVRLYHDDRDRMSEITG